MRPRWTVLAVCAVATLAISLDAVGQARRAAPSRAETGLVGVKLYDQGTKLIGMFGNPLEIQGVSIGGSSIGPTGGGGNNAGGGGGTNANGGSRGGPRSGGGGGTASGGTSVDATGPMGGGFSFGNDVLNFQGRGGTAPEDELSVNPNAGGGGGGGSRDGSGRSGGGAGGGAAGGSTDRILFTRWVYKRGNSKYGFILDKSNRVVQIEALGLKDSRVRTSRGVSFGATFGDLIRKYGAPEGYEINGDSLAVRFLINNKVAFRLNRLGKDQPHRVTGIVVSGGKV